ncbi:2-octaprenyl-3-methyl-6-methoxy-1,4-benzoquinol hydroxylase [Salmonella enterica subsp. enterica serovar Choleraesuis]|nr:2-octaprenyl-3-methyl-6-methoxy-1,4-benzoquinol hydroxylase [Salmonella enterica subsp. enterica serovar Choleraesuis]
MAYQHTEIAVVGGGMVGAAAALGLAREGFEVTVIEQYEPPHFDAASLPDVRISALSSGSVALLSELDVWPAVRAMRCHPYNQLETWEWETAHVGFSAAELKLPVLGYMVENHVLQRALWEAMAAHPQITLRCPATLSSMTQNAQERTLHFADGEQLNVSLVIGADGANSRIRQWAGIGVDGWEYPQSCMLISVRCAEAPGGSTWQQFTPAGPRAFLPLFGEYASLVWYDSPQRIKALSQLSMPRLADEIARHFPARLGDVEPLACGAFPLVRRHAQRYYGSGVVLIGDAAHTIHPLAGQGVNLGYRDVAELIDVLARARKAEEQWASDVVLQRYQRRRRGDNLMMQSAMDLFYGTFSNSLAPLRVARNLGLMAAGRAGGLKRAALKYALGL